VIIGQSFYITSAKKKEGEYGEGLRKGNEVCPMVKNSGEFRW